MIIIYNKETGEVLFDGARPLDYSKREPVYRVTYDENNEKHEELIGYKIYFNPEIYDTAEVDNIPKGRTLIYKDGVISVKQEQARNV